MTEKLYRERPDVAQRLIKLFVEATKTFIENPKLAEKYVRENMFKGQISSEDYQDAIANSPFTFEVTVEHIALTTELMQQYGVGRLANAPRAADWVKLDLLANATRELGVGSLAARK
jgi:NitT/TauT family transport system substrate-binding protein